MMFFAVCLSCTVVVAAAPPHPGSPGYKAFELKEDEKSYGMPKDPLPTKLQACCACQHYMQEDIRDCVATRKALVSTPAHALRRSEDARWGRRRRGVDARAHAIGEMLTRSAAQAQEQSYWGDLSGFFRRLAGAADKDELPPTLYKDGIAREREDQLRKDCYNSMKCTVGKCPGRRQESASFRALDRSGNDDAQKFCWAPLPFISQVVWGQDCSDLEVYPQCNQLEEDRWPELQAALQKEGDVHEAHEYDVALCCVLGTCDPAENMCPVATEPGAGAEVAGLFRAPPTTAAPTPTPTDAPFALMGNTAHAEAQHKLAAFDLRGKRRFEEKRNKKQERVAARATVLEQKRAVEAASKTAHALARQRKHMQSKHREKRQKQQAHIASSAVALLQSHATEATDKVSHTVARKRFFVRFARWGHDQSTWNNHQWTVYCAYLQWDKDCANHDDDDDQAKEAKGQKYPQEIVQQAINQKKARKAAKHAGKSAQAHADDDDVR